jgi:hypothetical protein
METQVRTPQSVFMMPQRLTVPLFQRPYVWNQERQWEPLWEDVIRVAERRLAHPAERHTPHFLGAVVLQQIPNPIGLMQHRTIIDGQQRLTTLQLMLDALQAELTAVGATQPAERLQQLVANGQAFCTAPEDSFKVWPTNRDRPSFNDVMGATPPVDHDALPHKGSRMVEAHRYFGTEARKWLTAGGPDQVSDRAAAIDATVRDLLQLVVIDLAADENAQEIFETLNARGAQLTAADLIKNFIFQRLLEANTAVETAYDKHWKDFETAFWEAEINVGRLRYQRSSIYLNHWLIARTGEEIVAREVFSRFKTFATFDAGQPMLALLAQIHRAAGVYRSFIIEGDKTTGALDRLAFFSYRISVLESEVIKPVVLWLLDPDQPAVPAAQFAKALDAMESWLMRRMLIRVTSKSYSKVIADLIRTLRASDRARPGDAISKFFADQTAEAAYWPDDEEMRGELRTSAVYRRLSRGRLRLVLESIEDYGRGWRDGKDGLGGERVARGKYAIEHILPRSWQAHWPLTAPHEESERERLVHTIGNLTLLTKPLNSKVSNGPWTGPDGKWAALEAHDVLLMNNDLRKQATDAWTHDRIKARTERMIDAIIAIWPTPAGHRVRHEREKAPPSRKLDLADLLNAGILQAGMTLYPGPKKFAGRTATLLADGSIEVDGVAHERPRAAARVIAGRSKSGLRFFRVDRVGGRSLREEVDDYRTRMALEADGDDGADEGEDE